LKRKEMISARFGDILSELYLSSAALKRWNDEGRQDDDFPLLQYCMEASLATIEARFDELIANFPVRPVAWLLRLMIQPLGPRRRGPSDRVTDTCADLITTPNATRDRLTVDLFHPSESQSENGVALLERAFALTAAVQPIRDRMHTARVRDIDQAVKRRTITADEAEKLKAAADAVAAAIAVNDFAPEELTSRGAFHKGDQPSQATSQPTPPTPAPTSDQPVELPPPEDIPVLPPPQAAE
jgi:acyl-CoA dehydrogenase